MNNKRKQIDIKNLLLAGYNIVETEKKNPFDFIITNFKGPKESLYENGIWKIHVQLPDNYPYKSPSIGFINKIFHPNVDEKSGTICLDVLNQKWSPLFELKNVFEVFLPQLLLYPNPSDPLNHEAANLLLHHKNDYKEKVKKYIKSYADDGSNQIVNPAKEINSTEERFLTRKSSRITADDEYDLFFNDDEDIEDNKSDDSEISRNSSFNEEISFGKIH